MKEREDACTVTWAQYDARVGVRPPKKDTSPSKGSLLARTALFSALPSARAARPFPFRFRPFQCTIPTAFRYKILDGQHYRAHRAAKTPLRLPVFSGQLILLFLVFDSIKIK